MPSTATLYNTNLVFGPDGALLTVHRKLKPTGSERLVWGEADRGFAPVTDTPWGPVGSLICWESYMSLLRTALYQKGMTICLAPNTNDYDSWLATVRHIAVEGRCFYVNADLCFTRDMYPAGLQYPEEIAVLHRYRLPRRKLRRRPLWQLRNRALLGPGWHPVC